MLLKKLRWLCATSAYSRGELNLRPDQTGRARRVQRIDVAVDWLHRGRHTAARAHLPIRMQSRKPAGNQCSDVRPAPTISVDPKSAVAVTIGGSINHHMLNTTGLANGHYHFQAYIGSAQTPRNDTTAAQSCYTELVSIDIAACFQ